MEKDPSGRAPHGHELMLKYRGAIARQHGRLFEAWQAGLFTDALTELHFFLISIDRVHDGLTLAAQALGDPLAAHVATRDMSDYRDARNHFEHLDDRLFGTKRKSPRPITENGATRTVHFGLKAGRYFEWGDKRIDLSTNFLRSYTAYLEHAENLMLE
jgi:hypothetical protein